LSNDSFGTEGAIDGGLTMTNGTLTGASDLGGIISVDTNGTSDTLDDKILYTPKSGFIGEDEFKYTITDATGDTSITIVTVTVEEIATPTAVNDDLTVMQDSGLVNLDVLSNDSFGSNGPGSITILTPAGLGEAVVNGLTVDYTPLAGSVAADSFEYTLIDGSGNTDTAIVSITISSIGTSDVPTAFDDAVTVSQDSGVNNISILVDNGSGPDTFGSDGRNVNHPISLSGTYTDNGGKIDLVGDIVEYTPRLGFSGVDTFGYTITDLNGDADTATVTVTVTASTSPKSVPTSRATVNLLENEFIVYPNPSVGYVKSSLISNVATKASLLLFDVTGKTVYSSIIDIKKGNNTFELNLTLKPGIIFMKVISSEVDFGTSKIVFK